MEGDNNRFQTVPVQIIIAKMYEYSELRTLAICNSLMCTYLLTRKTLLGNGEKSMQVIFNCESSSVL